MLETKKKIGQLLCENAYLDDRRLKQGLAEQQQRQGPSGQQSPVHRLGRTLVGLGFINDAQLNETLSQQAGIEPVDLDEVKIDSRVLSLIPAELVSKYNCLPINQTNGRLVVAMSNPFDTRALEEMRLVTGLSISRRYGHPVTLERTILKFYGSGVARMLDDLAPVESTSIESSENGDYSPAKLHELAREPSLVNLVNLILLEALDAGASDVHIEPFENDLRCKYRIDGVLVERAPSPKRLQAAIISRIKIMANMNIAERFIPQDGHIEFTGHVGKVDIRVATIPTIFGESVTMRLLDRSTALLSLEQLGMNKQTLTGFDHCLGKSHGIVLVTGPTGSGKTTTLYASLNKIFTPSRKFITIEDPVEYQLDGVIQIPVNPKRGLTFAKGLRHILRQDPDIIMVGEIRDKETADTSIRAALTGHLVFSTLHTNDAAGSITRLIDMGVEPFLLASSLEAVLAQRLVRKICKTCREPYQPEEMLRRSLSNAGEIGPETTFYHGRGCDDCQNTGLRGRIGIYELLRVTDVLRELIAERPTTEQILKAAPDDHVSMRHDGTAKVLEGLTTPEEILRATQEMDEE